MVPAFGAPGRLISDHPEARELFPRYLATGGYLTLVMIPLMESALERARALAPSDPVAAGLVEYLEHHIPEEMHGDEPGGAALDDLEALGVDVGALRAGPVPPKVAELIGNQYFWIWHHHPVALLGLLELEAYHPDKESVEQLMERTGLPPDGFRQLLLHADLDVDDAEELHQVLDSLPLDARARAGDRAERAPGDGAPDRRLARRSRRRPGRCGPLAAAASLVSRFAPTGSPRLSTVFPREPR